MATAGFLSFFYQNSPISSLHALVCPKVLLYVITCSLFGPGWAFVSQFRNNTGKYIGIGCAPMPACMNGESEEDPGVDSCVCFISDIRIYKNGLYRERYHNKIAIKPKAINFGLT